MAYKGRFKPKNPEKYMGDYTGIIYRSSWERHFFVYCDNNPSIIQWASEEIIIPYRYMGKKHRYFPDVYIRYRHHDGTIKAKLIEIKPHAQKSPPRQSKNRGRYLRAVDTYAKNQAKWKAAEAFCEHNNIEWMVMDEYDLGLKQKTKKMIAEEKRRYGH